MPSIIRANPGTCQLKSGEKTVGWGAAPSRCIMNFRPPAPEFPLPGPDFGTAQVFLLHFTGSQYPQFGARERGRGGFVGFGFGVRVRRGIRLDKLTNRLDKTAVGFVKHRGWA